MTILVRVVRFVRVALAAREVQDFLWNTPGTRQQWGELPEGWDQWCNSLAKRLTKMTEVRGTNPHWPVEAKKRLLQTAAVAVAFMEAIDNNPERLRPPR